MAALTRVIPAVYSISFHVEGKKKKKKTVADIIDDIKERVLPSSYPRCRLGSHKKTDKRRAVW